MKKDIAITDLTRMQQGRVCIAGYDREGNCIRPVLPHPGISQNSILRQNKAIIFPNAVVEFDFIQHIPKPPHTEDHIYDPASPHFVKVLTEKQKRTVLLRSLFNSVAEIFEQPLLHDTGFSVMDGIGTRSAGTVQPAAIHQVHYEADEGKWDYRIGFYDADDKYFRLKITDLTWHYYCNSKRGEKHEPRDIAKELTQMLKQKEVYLRVGLSRGWAKFPDRCFLQVNGIHTFPDYLQGKTFADLIS